MTQTPTCSFRINLSIVLMGASLLVYNTIYIYSKNLFLKLTQINVKDFREKLITREWIGVRVTSSCYVQEFKKGNSLIFLKFILSIRKI